MKLIEIHQLIKLNFHWNNMQYSAALRQMINPETFCVT